MTCALCDVPVMAEDRVLIGGHVVCARCEQEVAVGLIAAAFPDEFPEVDRVAAGVRRRVANRREEAALRLQGVMAL